jgi:hypothetical protein
VSWRVSVPRLNVHSSGAVVMILRGGARAASLRHQCP